MGRSRGFFLPFFFLIGLALPGFAVKSQVPCPGLLATALRSVSPGQHIRVNDHEAALARRVQEMHAEMLAGRESLSNLVAAILSWQVAADFPSLPTNSWGKMDLFDASGSWTEQARSVYADPTGYEGKRGLLPEKLERFRETLLATGEVADRRLGYVTLPKTAVSGTVAATAMMQVVMALDFESWPLYRFAMNKELGTPANHIVIFLPTLNQLQGFLDAKYDSPAVQLLPVWGEVDSTEIRHQIAAGYRVFGLSFPGVQAPEIADNIPANRTGFAWHDVLHAAMGSRIIPKYRALLSRSWDVIELAHAQAIVSGGRVPLSWFRSLNEAEIPERFQIGPLRRDLIDFLVRSNLDPNGTTANFGARLVEDFGSLKLRTYLWLIVQDVGANREWYEQQGISPAELIAQIKAASPK